MTTCALGAVVKSGVDPNQRILVDRYLWEQATGAATSWLDPILAAIVPVTIKASDLCALNLDDPPLPSVSDIALAFSKDPASVLVLVDWVRRKLEYAAFAQACVCTAPGGTVVTCEDRLSGDKTSAGSGGVNIFADPIALHVGATKVTPTFYADSCFGGANVRYDFGYKSPGGVYTSLQVFTGACQNVTLTTVTVDPATMASFYMQAQMTNGVGATVYHWHGELLWQCPATTTPPAAPVVDPQPPAITLPPSYGCTTIGDICTRLQQLADKLDWTYAQVNLIQRQKVPFAYLPGTVFTGLSGNGEVAVSGILAVSVEATDHPLTSVEYGHPNERFDNGWINVGDSAGWLERHWLATNPTFVRDVPAFATKIGYSLPPGVVATLRTYTREP